MTSAAPARLVLMAILGVLLAGPAFAAKIIWQFEAQVRDFSNGSVPSMPTPAAYAAVGVVPGASIKGFFEFESTTPDTDPGDPTYGRYENFMTDFQVSVGSITLSPLPTGSFTFARTNTQPPPGTKLFPYAIVTPVFDDAGLGIFVAAFELIDSDGVHPIKTDALPLTPPELALFDAYDSREILNSQFTWTAFNVPGAPQMRAEILSMTVVPEPGTGLLLMCGLIGMAGVRRLEYSY